MIFSALLQIMAMYVPIYVYAPKPLAKSNNDLSQAHMRLDRGLARSIVCAPPCIKPGVKQAKPAGTHVHVVHTGVCRTHVGLRARTRGQAQYLSLLCQQ